MSTHRNVTGMTLSGIALFILILVSTGVAAGANNSVPTTWPQAMTGIQVSIGDSRQLKIAIESATALHPDECATFRNLAGLSLEAWSTNRDVSPIRQAIECLAASPFPRNVISEKCSSNPDNP